jgi:hypothetical protein
VSDLHCPATLLLAPYDEGAGPTEAGTRGLVERAAADNVGRIYGGTAGEAAAAMGAVEAGLTVPAERRPELDEADVSDELAAIADLHRGEAVLVLLPLTVLEVTLDALVGRRARLTSPQPVHYGSVVEVAADADGWALRATATPADSAPDLVPDREIP